MRLLGRSAGIGYFKPFDLLSLGARDGVQSFDELSAFGGYGMQSLDEITPLGCHLVKVRDFMTLYLGNPVKACHEFSPLGRNVDQRLVALDLVL
jgi:hypothetical protein